MHAICYQQPGGAAYILFSWHIQGFIYAVNSFEELILATDSILNDLTFGVEAEKFERALTDVGIMLGFISQRPDKEFRKGPDNLWCGVDSKYFLFECKSEVEDSREEIAKFGITFLDIAVCHNDTLR